LQKGVVPFIADKIKANKMRSLIITKQITVRDDASLKKYLNEIGKVPMLTVDEEVELTKKIGAGDNDALEKLTKANLRFVVSVAKQYQNNGLSLGDLISEGNIGLIKAAHRFDEQRGFKFISYAVWWIRQSILQSLDEHARIVRLPINKVSQIKKIKKVFSELSQKFERSPSDAEIAEILNISMEDVVDTMRSARMHVSIDAPLSVESNSTWKDIISSETGNDDECKNFNTTSLLKELEYALGSLESQEATVLRLYFGLNEPALSYEEIGDRMEIKRNQVRQIKEKAIGLLKRASRSSNLKDYLVE